LKERQNDELAYIIWGDRLEGWKRDVNAATDGVFNAFGRAGRTGFSRTGNVAFDDWREKELARIEEERRKLDEMRADFETYVRELRRAKDQDEFDRFMAARSKSAPARRSKSVPNVVDEG
jgi:hypothetical protein